MDTGLKDFRFLDRIATEYWNEDTTERFADLETTGNEFGGQSVCRNGLSVIGLKVAPESIRPRVWVLRISGRIWL